MENKKESLRCVICGRNDRFRLVMRNTLMPVEFAYVICLECINEAKKRAEETQNKNRYDWRIEKPKEDENDGENT